MMNNGMQAIMDAILQQQMRPNQLEVDEMYNKNDPQKQEMMEMQTDMRSILDSLEYNPFIRKKKTSEYGSLAGA